MNSGQLRNGDGPYVFIAEIPEDREPPAPMGRVTSLVIPAAELAVIEHRAAPAGVDRAYGTLAAYVASQSAGLSRPTGEGSCD